MKQSVPGEIHTNTLDQSCRAELTEQSQAHYSISRFLGRISNSVQTGLMDAEVCVCVCVGSQLRSLGKSCSTNLIKDPLQALCSPPLQFYLCQVVCRSAESPESVVCGGSEVNTQTHGFTTARMSLHIWSNLGLERETIQYNELWGKRPAELQLNYDLKPNFQKQHIHTQGLVFLLNTFFNVSLNWLLMWIHLLSCLFPASLRANELNWTR